MKNQIWLRSETKMRERRTPLTPNDAKKLIEAGAKVHVEDDPNRIFPIEAYKQVGCIIEEAHSWPTAPKEFIILGLKEVTDPSVTFSHQHIYFAHIYKGQKGADDIIQRYKKDGGILYDLEYLTDVDNRRISAFGRWAGFAGAAFALDKFYNTHAELGDYPPLRSYESVEELLKTIDLKKKKNKKEPKVIIIGALGRCGSGAKDLFDKFSVEVTSWDYQETKSGGPFKEILNHDIFINAALINKLIPPFINNELLNQYRGNLEIIADVSCDPNSDLNPIPIYNQNTSWDEPFLTIVPNGKELEILSVDNLPSTLPKESSIDFSDQLIPYLLELVQKKGSLPLPFENSYQVFKRFL